MSDQIANINDSPAEKLAGGFGFTEGPLWHPDGHWLFVDIRKLQIHKMSTSGQLETFRDPSFGTNGMTFDKQGNLVICESDNRQIMRRQADGSYTAIATHADGNQLNRPLRRDPLFHGPGRTPHRGRTEVGLQRRPRHLPRRRQLGGNDRDRVSQRPGLLSR